MQVLDRAGFIRDGVGGGLVDGIVKQGDEPGLLRGRLLRVPDDVEEEDVGDSCVGGAHLRLWEVGVVGSDSTGILMEGSVVTEE